MKIYILVKHYDRNFTSNEAAYLSEVEANRESEKRNQEQKSTTRARSLFSTTDTWWDVDEVEVVSGDTLGTPCSAPQD